jgi:hypothetical protein
LQKANQRTHKTLCCRRIDRLGEERATMAPLLGQELDLDERVVVRVPADPHVRVEKLRTCRHASSPVSSTPAVISRCEARTSTRRPTIAGSTE